MIQVSFNETQGSYIDGSKDLTRRIRWRVKPGEMFMGVDKMQGIPKGGHRTLLGPSTCITVTEEPVDEIIRRPLRYDAFGALRSEVVREGFPAFLGREGDFVRLLLKINKGLYREDIIKRVEFKRSAIL